MYITDQDYRLAISEEEQAIISEYPQEWQAAELASMELASGYLRARYDVDKEFRREGSERSPLLVLTIVHLTLYQMCHRLPMAMAMERYRELYDGAIQWLSDVQKGRNNPNLPIRTDPETGKTGLDSIRSGSLPKSTYHY